ncbi:MFS transporter [Lysinibacillus sp. NPDC097287]|uniref:MFS transporter n=1 Tax=Lysinibacillus sp. NPDC097287 TaxID=3364144 RepID=UPI00383049F5
MTRKKVLLLSSIGVANVGEWVYFIALNLLVLNLTQSPLAVIVLYILAPIATITTSLWAGSLVDRLNQRKLLIALDLSRAVLVVCLFFSSSLVTIYCLSFFIHIANATFATSSLVYMTRLVPTDEQQRFNALKNFIQTAGFIVGPSIAGVLFFIGTPTTAILFNSVALVCSSMLISRLPNMMTNEPVKTSLSWSIIKADWHIVYHFSKKHIHLVLLYLLFCNVIILTTAIDSLEVSFATIVLNLSTSMYGLLVSVAGVGAFTGAIVNSLFSHKFKLKYMIGYGTLFTAIGYLIFSISHTFTWAAIGFFVLTFAFSFANTGFLTYVQQNIPINILGRFTSIYSIAESFGILVLTLGVGILSQTFGIRLVVFSATVLLIVVASLLISHLNRK